jgi:hypothetical protein
VSFIIFVHSWALEALVILRMQAAVRASLDDENSSRDEAALSPASTTAPSASESAPSAAGSCPDFEGLSDSDIEMPVEMPMGSDVQLSRVQLMRLRMRRQLGSQLASAARQHSFLSEKVDLMDVEAGVGAFANCYPPTINAGRA